MTETQSIIEAFFRDTLKIDVRSIDEDLIEQGRLDSLGLVELIFFLEQRFAVTIDFMKLDLVQVSSVGAMSRVVDALVDARKNPSA